MIITVLPPVVQPSLGEIALMQGTADDGYRPEKKIGKLSRSPHIICLNVNLVPWQKTTRGYLDNIFFLFPSKSIQLWWDYLNNF